jgi:hypothetical protein
LQFARKRQKSKMLDISLFWMAYSRKPDPHGPVGWKSLYHARGVT